jgi:hypothetical protein
MRRESIAIEGLMSGYNRAMVIRQTNLLFISEGLAEELAVVGRRVDLVLHIVATNCLDGEGDPTDTDMLDDNRQLQDHIYTELEPPYSVKPYPRKIKRKNDRIAIPQPGRCDRHSNLQKGVSLADALR